jgi:hypothetical protein
MQASMDVSPFNKGRESTIWGVSLMLGYLGYDFCPLLLSTLKKIRNNIWSHDAAHEIL